MEYVYSKYYITDSFGNYYRIDNQGKLVAAHSKNDATVFTYEELEERLGKNKRSKFYKSVPADDAVLEGYLVSGIVVKDISEKNLAGETYAETVQIKVQEYEPVKTRLDTYRFS